jgi:hypothetical protein
MTDQIQPNTLSSISAPPAPAAAPSSRRRWMVALGAAAVVVVGIIAIALGAGKSGTAAVTPRYLPATTVAFLDARFDLPGDQRDQVAALLARFPGFADQAALDTKMAEAFDRILKAASADRYSYSTDIKPWFGGRVAVAMTGLPAIDSSGAGANSMPPVLGLVSVSDAAKARTELDKLLKDVTAAGATVTDETIDGATLWQIDDPKAQTAQMGHAVIALTGDMIVVGDSRDLVVASVALGRGSGETLAGSAAFTTAVGVLPEARLGTLYVDTAALKIALAALASAQPGLDTALAALPERVAGSLRVADGSVIIEVRAHAGSAGPRLAVHASTLAARVPADSVAFVEIHDVGAGLKGLLTTLKAQLGSALAPDQLKAVETVLGAPLESLFDWVGDAAVVAHVDGAASKGALVAAVTDTATAKARLATVATFISLAGLDPSAGIHVTTADHAGTVVTELTLDQAPGVKIGWALKDDLFVLGVGEGAVTWVLDVSAQTSLTTTPGYQAAIKAAGADMQGGLVYVDLAGLRTSLEGLIPPESQAQYQETRPLLLPISAAIAVSLQDGDDIVARIVLITTKP